MTSDRNSKPFPWRCPSCFASAVKLSTTAYQAKVKHDGRLHEFEIPRLSVPQCESCGELVFGNNTDAQIMDGLRDHLRLLKPDHIRAKRQNLGYTQKQMGQLIGVAAETISRWESGALIQSRANDNLMRVFFDLPQVRRALAEDSVQAKAERRDPAEQLADRLSRIADELTEIPAEDRERVFEVLEGTVRLVASQANK